MDEPWKREQGDSVAVWGAIAAKLSSGAGALIPRATHKNIYDKMSELLNRHKKGEPCVQGRGMGVAGTIAEIELCVGEIAKAKEDFVAVKKAAPVKLVCNCVVVCSPLRSPVF